mmetsp:Transcript_157990/g.303198  ORF Transcript_157990/g.303198 Transcript_157990/m.303198 type:complete len:205 (-) Transcript_157990:292-906(-)
MRPPLRRQVPGRAQHVRSFARTVLKQSARCATRASQARARHAIQVGRLPKRGSGLHHRNCRDSSARCQVSSSLAAMSRASQQASRWHPAKWADSLARLAGVGWAQLVELAFLFRLQMRRRREQWNPPSRKLPRLLRRIQSKRAPNSRCQALCSKTYRSSRCPCRSTSLQRLAGEQLKPRCPTGTSRQLSMRWRAREADFRRMPS